MKPSNNELLVSSWILFAKSDQPQPIFIQSVRWEQVKAHPLARFIKLANHAVAICRKFFIRLFYLGDVGDPLAIIKHLISKGSAHCCSRVSRFKMVA